MRRAIFPTLLSIVGLGIATAQPNKEMPKKEAPPQIVVVPTLGIDAGKTTKLIVRGLRVDTATEIRLQEPKASGKILGKGKKIPVPNQADPNRVGDSEIEIEVTLPAEVPGRTVPFSLINSGGESTPHSLLVNDDTARTAEKEPNDGFRQTQKISLPSIIEGSIKQAQDVDVFEFTGKQGQDLRCEVYSRAFGSPLEPIVYLYDADGQLLTSAECPKENEDPSLKFKLPRDGQYFLSILDAHDQGSAIHVYRFRIQ